ncbi:MAG: LysM peptidoglycan-binding domain-containing protein [Candidatus Hydrogenedentota bacterium]
MNRVNVRSLAILSFSCLLLVLSGARAFAREVIVREGESLSMIAARELGSMNRWEEIAQLNNISDPRRVQAGMRLLIPGTATMSMDPTTIELGQLTGGSRGQMRSTSSHAQIDMTVPPPPSPEPNMSTAHVRPRSGATRFRSGMNAPWQNLAAPIPVEAGAQVMTANTGWADMRSGDAFLEVGPFSILRVDDLMPQGGAMVKLQIGMLTAHSQGSPVLVEAEAAKINVTNAEAKIIVDSAGILKVTPTAGVVKILTPDAKVTTIEPGKVAWVRRGGPVVVKEQISAVMLISPVGNSVVADRDILFEWTPLPGARGYKFSLMPEDPSQPKLDDQQTANPKIMVTSVPEGRYTWRVVPLGMVDAIGSIPGRFSVARNAPDLELMPPYWTNGAWWLKGMTAPNAWVTVGDFSMRANEKGEFSTSLGAGEGILMLGVESRMTAGGAAARKAMAIAARPSRSAVPVVVKVPSGRMMLNDEAAPPEITLSEGRNAFFWQWVMDDNANGFMPQDPMRNAARNEIARGRFELMVDMSAPLIMSVMSSAPKVQSGEEVTIRINAEDKGSGLGDASTASIMVEGPNYWKQTVTASSLSGSNEYVFRFRTPANLPSGVLKITQIEIADNDGNAIILHGEGMSTDVEDPHFRFRDFFKNILLMGAGIGIGIAI